MVTSFLTKIFGSANIRQIKKLQPIVDRVNAREAEMRALSDEALREKTTEFRERLTAGETLNDLLPEVFAAVREAAVRHVGMRPYDVQIMGGIILHQGKISEMKTGEGKTLTATMPLCLNALEGKGAHLVTVNDYLALRDAEWNRPIYEALGMTVSTLQNDMGDQERKDAYGADIMYATNNELGFDYLRDNMKFRLEDYVQRDLNFAIVDEIDSILIDEARTPLIISGSTGDEGGLYEVVDRVVRTLKKDEDFDIDEKQRSVQLTEVGTDKVESAFNVDNLYNIENLKLLHHVNQALKAHGMFKRDVEYVIRDGQVLIVDEFTGRILGGRRYSDGLHQALEAKEGVTIEAETQTLASITLQNFFRLYKKLAGMTGTAQTEAEEFHKIYKLDVVAIPTHRDLIRIDKNDLIFLTKAAKYKAIVEDVKKRHTNNQPVLIGTVAVETSELLSQILSQHGIPHEVLNAKQHAREAEIIEFAGKPGRITIATNMAGRGTDIKLLEGSKEAGGLYILGTERHESRRIDNQLRGRSGRQGDAGESRFYIALDDDLIRVFGGANMRDRMERWGFTEDEEIESPSISKMIQRSQEKVEKQNFETRKHLIEYDDVLNQHRKVIYEFRREVLGTEEEIYDRIQDMIISAAQDTVTAHCPERILKDSEIAETFKALSDLTHIREEELEAGHIRTATLAEFQEDIIKFLLTQYTQHRTQYDPELLHEAEKWLVLETIDKAWKQHMLNIDHLKEGINLRSMGQKNPLTEYKREAFDMFTDMLRNINHDLVHRLFHANIAHFNKRALEEEREKEMESMNLGSGKAESSEAESSTQQGPNRAQRRAQKRKR